MPLFRYALQPLLRKRSSELDRAREDLAAAALQVDTRERELREQVARVEQLQDHQRYLNGAGTIIDVDARLRLYDCLRSTLVQKERYAAQLQQAQRHHDAVIDQVSLARQALKALERHRENAHQQHRAEQVRRGHDASDELHLAGRRSASPDAL